MKKLLMILTLFVATQAAAEQNFRFNFAYQNPELGGLGQRIDLQAAAETEQTMIQVCGANGSSCVCEAKDAGGKLIGRTDASHISYDGNGNFFRCFFVKPRATIATVRIFRNKISSPALPVKSSLTIYDLLGGSLDANQARTIFRYSCEQTYLQKEGTTMDMFDCSHQATQCSVAGDFCLLKSRFPYYLYSDNYASNFHEKIADHFYNSGGSGRICGLQIKQFDCADAQSIPSAQFGIYAQQIGIWRSALALNSSPDAVSRVYGYVARTGPTGECPPGLEKRVMFSRNVDASDITPSHNFPSGIVVAEVAAPSREPSPFEINRYDQGQCNGSTCTMPVSFAGNAKPAQPFFRVSSEFCVIPATLLPLRPAARVK